MVYSRNALIAALRAGDITYLAPSVAVETTLIPSEKALIAALLEQADSRLHLALIPLFIRQPDLAQHIPAWLSNYRLTTP